MWVDRKTWDETRIEEAVQRGAAQELAKQVISLQSMNDWLTVRLTQLEHERAVLISNYMGITVTAPTFQKTPTAGASDYAHPLQTVPSFTDIGDEEAQRLGVDWNPDGTLKQK